MYLHMYIVVRRVFGNNFDSQLLDIVMFYICIMLFVLRTQNQLYNVVVLKVLGPNSMVHQHNLRLQGWRTRWGLLCNGQTCRGWPFLWTTQVIPKDLINSSNLPLPVKFTDSFQVFPYIFVWIRLFWRLIRLLYCRKLLIFATVLLRCSNMIGCRFLLFIHKLVASSLNLKLIIQSWKHVQSFTTP